MNSEAETDPRTGRRNQDAFTLTELLVVLCVVAALALLALTARARSQPSSGRAACAHNLRRLTQAWQMYADDSSGRLPANGWYSESQSAGRPWVSGWLDYAPS